MAATLGSGASSAAFEGVRLEGGAGSEALGSRRRGGWRWCRLLGSSIHAWVLCDFGEAGDDGDNVATSRVDAGGLGIVRM